MKYRFKVTIQLGLYHYLKTVCYLNWKDWSEMLLNKATMEAFQQGRLDSNVKWFRDRQAVRYRVFVE